MTDINNLKIDKYYVILKYRHLTNIRMYVILKYGYLTDIKKIQRSNIIVKVSSPTQASKHDFKYLKVICNVQNSHLTKLTQCSKIVSYHNKVT